MHESNILKIKTETEKIVYEILESSKKINFTEKDENIKTMENELLKLKNEEFIISMVGTMKAGKSTTINAIVGQEILPSRVEAMTTLPTLITHIKGKVEPVLKLNKSYVISSVCSCVYPLIDNTNCYNTNVCSSCFLPIVKQTDL